MTARRRTAVLISGRGSNLAALIAAAHPADYPAEIVLVISNRPNAGGLLHATEGGIATAIIDDRTFPHKAAFEAELQTALQDASADLICLAGFMRLLSKKFVQAWRDRLLNIHPSLLPLFPGLHTHENALKAGVKVHGATVHFVRFETDTGPIIAQAAVPVLPDDSAETLGARVLAAEHRLYPLALRLVASGAARVVGDRVIVEGDASSAVALVSPSD